MPSFKRMEFVKLKENCRMIAKKGPAFWAVVIALILSLSAWGAGQRRNQQQGPSALDQLQQQAQTQKQQQQVIRVETKEEGDAYNAILKEQDPAKKVELAEAFIPKFPNSDVLATAQMVRFVSYSQLGKHKEAVAAGEQAIDATVKLGEKLIAKADADGKLTEKDRDNVRKKDKNALFLDKNSPQFQTFMNNADRQILACYKQILQEYQALNDMPKAFEWGEKALGYKPDDVDTLATVSYLMAERPPLNEAEQAKQMKRGEELVNQAITLLPTYLASPEAAGADKVGLTSQLHYTLGLIYLRQKRLGSSQQEFLTAIKSKPSDAVTYYRLGLAYVQDMKNDQAMDAFAKSAFLKGVSEQPARDNLKALYVLKNKSDQGLDDYIQGAGKKIGQ
jgi:tetratricopeptide (TPR) repeat protein